VLVTETMLVDEVNTGPEQGADLAVYLRRLGPTRAYLAVPTRPPAEAWVQPPPEAVVNQAFQILAEAGVPVGLMIGGEDDAFASSGDTEADLLSVTAVHPMRRSAVDRVLERNRDSWPTVERLIAPGRLMPVDYRGERFYLRRLDGEPGATTGGKQDAG
jgi:wyosine [tRNA(Phe)-imidazoG37] synthetase (radical SAM superfamily)